MAFTRRMGVESSAIRTQLIDAAEQIIGEEGCAALTARRLADKVNLKRQIVHYYFGTIDEVFLAVMRRGGERTRARLQRALQSDEPLRVMFREGHFATTTSLEFVAMAARHEGARAVMKGHIEEFRGLLAQALARELDASGLQPSIPPMVVTIVMMGIAETLAVESVLGATDGHAQTRALLTEWLNAYSTRGELLGHPSGRKARRVAGRPASSAAKVASRLRGKTRMNGTKTNAARSRQ